MDELVPQLRDNGIGATVVVQTVNVSAETPETSDIGPRMRVGRRCGRMGGLEASRTCRERLDEN